MPKRLRYSDRQHQIYVLIDPRDSMIRYVGISSDISYRFYEHSSYKGVNKREQQWMEELHAESLVPIIQVLEDVIPDTRANAQQREQYWIEQMMNKEYPLLN